MDIDDLKDLIKDGCDLLLMETGHQSPDEICRRVLENNWSVKALYFLHHGRTILDDYDGALKRCLEISPSVRFCNDKDVFEI